jgi:hypothetical protein
MSIEILIEGEGLKDIEVIHVAAGSVARDIVVAVAAKGGFPADEAVLFFEDGDEPIDLTAVIVEERHAGKIHHVHRARHIEVVVFYKNETIERRFRPAARVQRVLDWAVGSEGFKNIDPPIVPELELSLHNTTTPLPKNAHIGRFAPHHQPRLELDLIRGVIPNGAS